MRDQDRGVQGDGRWEKILLREGHPLDGGCGGRECETRAGEEKDGQDVDDEDTGTRRFLREKDCSAWEKWVGRGSGRRDAVVTDIVWGLVQLLYGETESSDAQRIRSTNRLISAALIPCISSLLMYRTLWFL